MPALLALIKISGVNLYELASMDFKLSGYSDAVANLNCFPIYNTQNG
jgi:hypothetical protein